jgi:ribA/ribD-fused uncharacterized protein
VSIVANTEQVYERASCIIFRKTSEPYGGLSNMAGGFPLVVNGIAIRTSEALYQACRYPHLPDIQRQIIAQASPMTAKLVSRRYTAETRPDWDAVRVDIMRWCLRVKLVQNWDVFSALLLSTDMQPIVEESRRDAFWGARPAMPDTLVGANALGRLLTELRASVRSGTVSASIAVAPLAIPQFALIGQPILPVIWDHGQDSATAPDETKGSPVQLSLFGDERSQPL